jgi:hypothetical protein
LRLSAGSPIAFQVVVDVDEHWFGLITCKGGDIVPQPTNAAQAHFSVGSTFSAAPLLGTGESTLACSNQLTHITKLCINSASQAWM